jgi:hypothetical protein
MFLDLALALEDSCDLCNGGLFDERGQGELLAKGIKHENVLSLDGILLNKQGEIIGLFLDERVPFGEQAVEELAAAHVQRVGIAFANPAAFEVERHVVDNAEQEDDYGSQPSSIIAKEVRKFGTDGLYCCCHWSGRVTKELSRDTGPHMDLE